MASPIAIEKAKGMLITTVNSVANTMQLNATELEGILSGILIQIQQQAKLELLNEVMKERERKDEDNG